MNRLLQAAHTVDGIVKGLKQPDWPASGWQSLHRLAGMLCEQCMAPKRSPAPSRQKQSF
jgi:DNA polymerase-3 subunit delta